MIRLKKALALDLFPKEEIGYPNTEEEDLDAFFKGFGAEIPPLDMLQKAVQNDSIHSFEKHPQMKFTKRWKKAFVNFVMNMLLRQKWRNMNAVTRHFHFSSYIKIWKMN